MPHRGTHPGPSWGPRARPRTTDTPLRCTQELPAAGVPVVEVKVPSGRTRGRHTDRLDAEQIARSVLAITATATPKAKTGLVEMIRTLRVTPAIAVRARTQAFNRV